MNKDAKAEVCPLIRAALLWLAMGMDPASMSAFDYSDWRRSAPDIFAKFEMACFDLNAWPEALNAVCEVFGWTVFALRTVGDASIPYMAYSARGATIADAYVQGHWWDKDPRAAAFARAPSFTLVTDADLVDAYEAAHSDFYRDFAMTHGVTHLLGWRFENNDVSMAFACNRAKHLGPATSAESEALKDLMGQASAACLLAHKISDARNRVVFETLVNAKAAACLLDRNGRMISVTPELEKLLEGVHIRKNATLDLAAIRPVSAVEDLRSALRSPTDEITRVRSFVMKTSAGRKMIALPLILRGAGADVFGGARALIIFRSVETPIRLDPIILIELFGLTSSEAAVVILIAQGRSVSESAAARQVTEHTIRAMLKSAFHKTGTHSQAELTALLLKTSVAIES